MSYLFFAWVACLAYAVEVIVSKLLSKYSIANPWLFNFIWSLMILIFTAPLAVVGGVGFPRHWGNLLLSALFYTLAGIFYVLALYRIDVSVLSPLFNFRSALSLILGVFLFGETLSLVQVLLIVVIFATSVLVTLDESWHPKAFLNSGVLFILFSCLWLSLMSVFIKRAVTETGYWELTLFMPLFSQFLLLTTLPFFSGDIKCLNQKNFSVTALVAAFGVLGTLAANFALSQNISLSTVILALPVSMVLAFVLSFVNPNLLESHSSKVYALRFSAAVVMISAALKLSWG